VKQMMRRVPVLTVVALVATLGAAGFATAQEGPPFQADEIDVNFSYSIDGDGETLNWSFDPDDNCTDGAALSEGCQTSTIEPNEEGEFNHGSYVSFFAENSELDVPGRGCLIAAVAQSGAGMPEDSDQAEDSGSVESPCPAGLWSWLQDKGEDDPQAAGAEDAGPPSFVGERGGRPADAGPPAGVGGRP
jgi:hypothetical protein